jgi:hypothetical protein
MTYHGLVLDDSTHIQPGWARFAATSRPIVGYLIRGYHSFCVRKDELFITGRHNDCTDGAEDVEIDEIFEKRN